MYSIILSTQSRLYLILFSNAHSVCFNLHLLLALNIAWNVCAPWQNEVCLAKCSQAARAPWHPSALQGESLVFSESSPATVPKQIAACSALHFDNKTVSVEITSLFQGHCMALLDFKSYLHLLTEFLCCVMCGLLLTVSLLVLSQCLMTTQC